MTSQPVDPPAPDRPAPRGWRIATLRGVPVYLGRSWPVIALVIVLTFAPALSTLGAVAYPVALAYAVLLLLSVLAHEAGHALVAQRFGHRVDAIVADLWGGHTTYQAHTNTPGRSALVALAGPAMNALLAGLAYAALPVVPPGVLHLLAGALFYSNAFVAAFNLLPGLPLDGGFLVDSLVWKATGDRTRGQLAAGWTGRIVTIGVVCWYLLVPLLDGRAPNLFTVMWMLLIAGFLWQGATAAIRSAHVQRLVNRVDVRTLVRPTTLVPATTPLTHLHTTTPGHVVVTTDPTGTPTGLLTDAVTHVPTHLWDTTPLSAATITLPPTAVLTWRPDLTTTDLLQAMAHAHTPAVLLHDTPTHTYGYVSEDDIQTALTH